MYTDPGKQKVLIIGAGASGLMAALELSSTHTVTILEAHKEPGGRMREGGAEFIHGQLPVSLDLINRAGLSFTPVSGQMYEVSDGQWERQQGIVEGWDVLLKQMEEQKEDTTIARFLQQKYPGHQQEAFREEVRSYVEGFDLADPEKVSVRYLYNEWSHEGDNFRIDKGYIALTEFLIKECSDKGVTIFTNTPVTNVDWKTGQIKVTCEDGRHFEADKLIVTIPLALLQHSAVAFRPSLPDYIKAARQIGWGTVIKFVLAFKEPFWEKYAENIGFIFSSEKVPTWWTQQPATSGILTGWLGGPSAREHLYTTEEKLLQEALHSLSAIFGIETSQLQEMLVSGVVYNWQQNPFAEGAYSYDTPISPEARRQLQTPVDNTIYFAGEAMYSGDHPGTVEAAFTSGKEVAAVIMQTIKS